jgi:hypothetical protein
VPLLAQLSPAFSAVHRLSLNRRMRQGCSDSWRDIARKLSELARTFPRGSTTGNRPARSIVCRAAAARNRVHQVRRRNCPWAKSPRGRTSPQRLLIESGDCRVCEATYAEGERTIRALTGDQLQSTIRVDLRSRPTASLYGLWDHRRGALGRELRTARAVLSAQQHDTAGVALAEVGSSRRRIDA